MTSPSARSPRRPVTVALCLMLALTATACIAASDAKAAYYKMVACAGNNGAPPYLTGTNTASPQNPGGIFEFHVWCNGAGGDPPGEHAMMRIAENQPGGNAGHGAYGHFVFDTPSYVHFKAAGGYTRQFNAFNDGWRARFWVASASSTAQIMIQGAGLPNSGGQWASTGIFGPHLWPIAGYWDFTRFVYEMQCVRPAGCDRSNYNATDLNGLLFILSDDVNSHVEFTGTGSALWQGRWVRGNHNATFQVSDLGSGLRHERLRIDGAQRWNWDHWPECNTSSSQVNGEWARSYQPCPTGGPWGRSVPLHTATLADGAHAVQVCTQDYGQYQGLNGTGGESCVSRTIRTDNTAPGAPSGLHVTSSNPQRYLDRVGAIFSLPQNQGSPITRAHYQVIDSAGEVVKSTQTLNATNPTALSGIELPPKSGAYRLRVWLEDQVGLSGPAATAQIPRDTTPPAAPQDLSVTAPSTSRAADGFDVRWRNVLDAGSPISQAHYRVRNAAGAVVVPTQTVAEGNVQSIANIETPQERGGYTFEAWLEDAEGNVGVPTAAPLAYQCMRSRVGGGNALTSGLGADSAGEEIVKQGDGSTLRGRVAAGTDGVSGAALCVFSRVVTSQAREFVGFAMSGPDGSYQFPIPAGASRELTVIYRSGAREVASRATIHTKVRPFFKVRRKVVYNKTFAKFTGSIPGPDNDRVVIVLQVRRGKGWLAFRRYRTRGDGKFTVGYRFNRTTVPTKYVMRAQVRTQAGYPYLQGNSKRLKLIVRPPRSKRHRGSASALPKDARPPANPSQQDSSPQRGREPGAPSKQAGRPEQTAPPPPKPSPDKRGDSGARPSRPSGKPPCVGFCG